MTTPHDPYAQQKAIAQSMQESNDRNERASVLSKLDEIIAMMKVLSTKSKKAE